jgi:HK97 family phage major capsid protein
MARTAREEALASIKSLQDKFQKSDAPLPADQMAAMFRELTDAVGKLAAPAAVGGRMKHFSADPGRKGFASEAELVESLPKEVQAGLDQCLIASKLLKRPVNTLKMFDRLVQGSPDLQKALDSTTAGEGDEWVPTLLSPDLVREVTVRGLVEQMHPHIPMPSNPYDVPIQAGRLTAYKATEQTADSGQTDLTIASGAGITEKLSLSAKGLGVVVLASKEVQEDSIVPILPFLREEVIMALVRGVEECVINGDTTATHQDTDIEAAGADDRRTLWKGYRKHALEQSRSIDFQGGSNAFDLETLLRIRAKHGKYGINPADLFWMFSLQGYFKALSLKDSAGNPVVTTIDKLGGAATVVTGVLGKLAGSDIAVSEFCRDDLNSSGVNGASGNTLSAVLSVQKSGFVFGDRRDASIQLLTEKYALSQQDALLSVIRKDFQPLRPIASNAAVAIGYNLLIA